MIAKILTIVLILLAHICSPLLSASAQNAAVGNSGTPALLTGGVSKLDTMSRTELDGQQAVLSPINPTDAQLLEGNLQNRTAMLNAAARNQAAIMSAAAQNNQFNAQAQQSDMSADIRTREYNVDWSGWISRFADRWFFVLKQFETANHAQYVTLRPALFQFTCYTNGTVANVVLKQSSGNDAYDRLQVIALMQSMPCPPFPAGTQRQSITLIQGWESHVRQPGESDFMPGSYGRGFPMEKVREWVRSN